MCERCQSSSVERTTTSVKISLDLAHEEHVKRGAHFEIAIRKETKRVFWHVQAPCVLFVAGGATAGVISAHVSAVRVLQ